MDFPSWLAGDELFVGPLEAFVRLLIAAVFGGVIGLDREARNKPAGLRTHILIAVAATLFMLLALEMHYELMQEHREANTDPIRIIEAVTAGVAFLAAGAIIRSREGVTGLTTGASMWLAGALGVASGGGYYTLAALATLLGVLVLTVLSWVERRWGKPSASGGASRD